MIKDFITYINEGLFDRNQSEFNIRKTDMGIEQVYIPITKKELYSYIDLDIDQAKKDITYPDVNLNNIDISELEDDTLDGLFSGDIYMINPDISDWNIKSMPSKFFYKNKKIKEFTISDSVISIEEDVFSGCSGLTSVTIPNSVMCIEWFAFEGCSSLTSVTIPNSVTSIGDGVFKDCIKLTSVTIPNSVMSIDWFAFEGCSSLTSVTIPNSVTIIGEKAFAFCSGLTSVTIGNSVTSIGESVFDGCSSLTKTNYTGDIAGWCGINFGNYSANPTTYSQNLYISDVEVKDLVIPNGVTSIGNYAFYCCSGLTSITIPNSVTIIGRFAFAYCSGLTSVTIPNSVTRIREKAFYGCSGLTSVTIPNSVTRIGDYAFYGCDELTSVTISKHCKIMPNSFPSDCKIIMK